MNGKIQANYGRIYVVDLPATDTTYALVENYFNSLINTVFMQMNTALDSNFTIIVPSRNYNIINPIFFNFNSFVADNKTLNIIGCTDNLASVLV